MTLYFICQSLPDQNSISTPSCVTGCAVFFQFEKRYAGTWHDYISHSFWSHISRFSSLRYLVCVVTDPEEIATWAEEQHGLREFADKQLFYHRLAHYDPESDVNDPSWIGIDPSSLEKSGEHALYSLGVLSDTAFNYCR